MATYQFHDIVKSVTRIDRRHGKRQVPMKILALGLCRTGTDCEFSLSLSFFFFFFFFSKYGFAGLQLTSIYSVETGLKDTRL